MGNGELFNGYRVSLFQDEKTSGDCLHNIMNVLVHLKLVKK